MIEEFRSGTLTVFHDLPVFAFAFSDPGELARGDTPKDIEAWAWHVGIAGFGDTDADEIFSLFLDTVDTVRIKALLLGAWSGDSSMSGEGADYFQRTLLDAADRFPALEALFISDIPQGLSEISWIKLRDPADLLAAFPRLRVLGMRGGLAIEFKPFKPFAHARLEELVLQSGGLPNSLDLSLGTLSVTGVSALLAGQPLTHLKRLDIHHHFLFEAMIERLLQAVPEVGINVTERMELQE